MSVRCLNATSNALALVILLLGHGCQNTSKHDGGSSPAEAKPMAIENITWQLAEVDGRPAEPVPADARAAYFQLEPAENRAAGYSGVNAFGGTYELSGQTLRFGPIAITRRAGPEPLMKQETAFSRALERTASWRAAGEQSIELLDAAGKPLARFTAKAG